MWDADHRPRTPARTGARKQAGIAAVEFALIALYFFTLVLGAFEAARLVYLFNTLQEATRRAAALAINAPFDPAAQDAIKARALFLDGTGTLLLGSPVTAAHLKIDYLSLSQNGAGALAITPMAALPSSPAENRINCLANPYGGNCIRFVRVRICQPGTGQECAAVPYAMLFSAIDFSAVRLPRSTTIVPAQTLGYVPGTLPGYGD